MPPWFGARQCRVLQLEAAPPGGTAEALQRRPLPPLRGDAPRAGPAHPAEDAPTPSLCAGGELLPAPARTLSSNSCGGFFLLIYSGVPTSERPAPASPALFHTVLLCCLHSSGRPLEPLAVWRASPALRKASSRGQLPGLSCSPQG